MGVFHVDGNRICAPALSSVQFESRGMVVHVYLRNIGKCLWFSVMIQSIADWVVEFFLQIPEKLRLGV